MIGERGAFVDGDWPEQLQDLEGEYTPPRLWQGDSHTHTHTHTHKSGDLAIDTAVCLYRHGGQPLGTLILGQQILGKSG